MANGMCCRQVPLCRPVRSWRARRGAVMRWVFALVAGLLIFVLASSFRTDFIDPGELSFQHAELTDCGTCHTAFHGGMSGWWRAALSDDVAKDDSQPCIACHKMGDRGLLPHSLPADELQARSKDIAPATAPGRSIGVKLAGLAFGKPQENAESLPCMTCHQEHGGAEADLTTMSDDRCTSCHQVQFDSLASGHPDFAQYPYTRRTRLQFDHTSHIDKHFRDQKMVKLAPGECRDCHKTDTNGRLMEVRSFETSCGACHGAQVAGAGRASAKGLAVFVVPGLDVISLRDSGAAVGEWPEYAEGTVPPFMNMLLSSDPKYRDAQGTLATIDDPLDLSEATADQLAAVETLVWGVKSLLYDLRADGVATLHDRLQKVLGRALTTAEKASLTALLPLDTIAAAQTEWFPALGGEIPRRRDGEKILMPMEVVPEPAKASNTDNKKPDDDEEDEDGEIGTGKDDDDDDDDEIGTGKDDDDDDDDEIGTGKDDDDDDDGEIGTGKDDDDDDDDDDEIGTGKDDDEDGEIATDEDDDDKKDAGKAGSITAVALVPAIEGAGAEDWNRSGGWYRDEFTLRYRPTGHEDQFIRAWLDLTAPAAPSFKASRQIFEELIDPKAPGLCGKCHSVDQLAETGSKNQGHKVNWTAYKPEDGLKTSVHFSHSAHFSLLDERGCLTCHKRDRDADYAGGFKDRAPATFQANFKPLPRAVCAECHTSAKAGDNCLTCHNYHLGVYQPVVAHTKGMLQDASNKP
jgi:predicted CXXCH cytochrome family protein